MKKDKENLKENIEEVATVDEKNVDVSATEEENNKVTVATVGENNTDVLTTEENKKKKEKTKKIIIKICDCVFIAFMIFFIVLFGVNSFKSCNVANACELVSCSESVTSSDAVASADTPTYLSPLDKSSLVFGTFENTYLNHFFIMFENTYNYYVSNLFRGVTDFVFDDDVMELRDVNNERIDIHLYYNDAEGIIVVSALSTYYGNSYLMKLSKNSNFYFNNILYFSAGIEVRKMMSVQVPSTEESLFYDYTVNNFYRYIVGVNSYPEVFYNRGYNELVNVYNDLVDDYYLKQHELDLMTDYASGVLTQYEDLVDQMGIFASMGTIGTLFYEVGALLNIEIFNHITIGTLLIIPLLFGLIMFVLKLIRS